MCGVVSEFLSGSWGALVGVFDCFCGILDDFFDEIFVGCVDLDVGYESLGTGSGKDSSSLFSKQF